VTGESIGAIGMTEPSAGSDLQRIRTTAVRDGDHWMINGSKTFITNGINADIVIVVCRTGPEGGPRGLSLFVVQSGTEGFTRGRKLDKLGLHAQDTAELFFDGVRVPAENLLGEEGAGFLHLMERLPRERMTVAVQGSPRRGPRSTGRSSTPPGAPRSASRSPRSRTPSSSSQPRPRKWTCSRPTSTRRCWHSTTAA
jgi:alkylation response protein AidB-like acyl-CoA dehydrogenase